MKGIFTYAVLLLMYFFAFSQPVTKIPPLILQGKLTNCPEQYLIIKFINHHEEELSDTIKINADGSFYLKTYKIKVPQMADIQRTETQINDIYLAPGYDLTITADATSYKTLFKTTTITGIGAETNRYRKLLFEHIAKNETAQPWYELNGPQLLAFAQKQRKSSDSIAHVVFDNNLIKESYFAYFKRMVFLNNQFNELYYLLDYVNQKKLSYSQSVRFLTDNFDNKILNDLSNEENLISRDYRVLVIGEYAKYKLTLDYRKDSTLRKKEEHRLTKIDEIYTGKVKEFALNHQMSYDISLAKNFDRLQYCKEMFKPYIDKFKDEYYRKTLTTQFAEKKQQLAKTAIGKPAPTFTLASNKGKTHSLADFKGKVVFIDLWASWCHACRAETPHLQILYNKYKKDHRIAFVSIAISDGRREWQKALYKDKPTWLQLIDKGDVVKNAYVANMIPQFVIINKKGQIVNFDAPEPSSGQKLESVLVKEMGIN